MKNTLPVRGVKQDVESDDDMAECLKYCIEPSEHTEINVMTQLKHQITEAQEEYKSNNKQPALPMYKVTVFTKT